MHPQPAAPCILPFWWIIPPAAAAAAKNPGSPGRGVGVGRRAVSFHYIDEMSVFSTIQWGAIEVVKIAKTLLIHSFSRCCYSYTSNFFTNVRLLYQNLNLYLGF